MSEQKLQTEAADGQSRWSAVLGEEYSEEERYLRETLAMLQESYAKDAKPYFDRLVALNSIRQPRMLVTLEQAQAMGLVPNV